MPNKPVADATGLIPNVSVPYDGGNVGKVIYEQSVIIDEKTLEPKVKVTERDLDKEIQSYKDECGMAYILKQIAAGRLSADQIRDHGNEGADILGVPQTLNDANQLNLSAQEEGMKAASELGMKKYTEEEFQLALNKAIKEASAAKAASGLEIK